MFEELKKSDPEIYSALKKEIIRQNENLELIASENFVSQAVLDLQGSVLTNKYAEGYPGNRYYGGCEYYDIIESLARERAKLLFNCEHVNVQPHSGTQANMAVYCSVLNIGDTIMGMHLSHGGHLSHGHPASFSGRFFNAEPIEVNKEGYIDYDRILDVAKKRQPKLIVCGASAYPRVIDFKKYREIADEVGAYLVADIAHIAGLVAAGLHPSPIPYCDFVTTTTHKTLRGPRGGMIMCKKEYAEQIDKTIFPGLQGGPLMHVIGAKAVAFGEALKPEFKDYQKQIISNAKALAKGLIENGFKLITGGTDNHLILVDVSVRKLTGKDVEVALDKAGITVNKNAIPYDTLPPKLTSGIRLGTPAVTSRGMKESEMFLIASYIKDAVDNINNDKMLQSIKEKVRQLTAKFPLYKDILETIKE